MTRMDSHGPLHPKLCLLQLIRRRVLLLQLLKRLGNLSFNCAAGSSLDLGGEFGCGNRLLA